MDYPEIIENMLLQEESNYDIDVMKEQSINMIQKPNFKQKQAFNAVMHLVKKDWEAHICQRIQWNRKNIPLESNHNTTTIRGGNSTSGCIKRRVSNTTTRRKSCLLIIQNPSKHQRR
jgi:hypothetical protein